MALPLLAALIRPILQAVAREVMRDVAADLVKGVTAEAGRMDLTVGVELDLSNLNRLKGKSRQAVYRAVQRAAKPVRAAVESGAGGIKRFGFLQKSIGTKTRMKKGTIYTVIGPKMSFTRKRPGKKATRGKGKGTKPTVAPYRYAWILEFGSKRTKPKEFLRPAWDRAGPGYRERVVTEIAAELAKINPGAGDGT